MKAGMNKPRMQSAMRSFPAAHIRVYDEARNVIRRTSIKGNFKEW